MPTNSSNFRSIEPRFSTLARNYIDQEKWSPLIYNFRYYFRLADEELGKTFRAEA
jgi:hypothetical protein